MNKLKDIQPRSIKELLQLLLIYIDLIPELPRNMLGLCGLAYHLHFIGKITETEHDIIYQYIDNNKPINFHTVFIRDDFYWERGLKEPRIKWLKKHIKLNS